MNRTAYQPFGRIVRMLFVVTVAVAMLSVQAGAQEAQTGGILQITRDSGSYTFNLNPFGTAGQNLPATPLIYEPLFFVNSLTGELTPLLGTSHEWSDDTLTLTVETREGAQWSDGEPFSAEDVAFTFNYLREYPALDTSGLWSLGLESVEATDENTVVFTFAEANTPLFANGNGIAGQLIVPEHVWSAIDNPAEATNESPVGTGPFLFDSFAPQLIKVVKNPNYWLSGQPYIDGVTWQVTNSNQASLLLLLNNEADYAYLNIPNVERTYVSRNPELNQYWWPVNNSNILFLNTAKAPFDDVAVRKAIAMAVDKADLAAKAYAGTSVGAANPSGIIPAQQEEWLDASLAEAGYGYDPEAARAMLTEAGYTVQNGNLTDPEGNALPTFNILVGAGWTDFITMAQIVSQNLEALGIESTIQQENWGSYSRALQSGTYDMAISWGWGNGPTPYYLYHQSFAPEFSAEVGELADSNFSRFTDPAITEALEAYRASSDEAAQREAINDIAEVVIEQVPYVPLTDRVQFSTYNLSNFTGWPTPENPYTDGGAEDTTAGLLMLREVRLK